jgi:hypothetical protein
MVKLYGAFTKLFFFFLNLDYIRIAWEAERMGSLDPYASIWAVFRWRKILALFVVI